MKEAGKRQVRKEHEEEEGMVKHKDKVQDKHKNKHKNK